MTTSSTYLPSLDQEDRWTPAPAYTFLTSLSILSLLLSLALILFEYHLVTTNPDRPFAAFTLVGIQLPALALQSILITTPSLLHLSRHTPPHTPATTLFLLATFPPLLTLLTLLFALTRLVLS